MTVQTLNTSKILPIQDHYSSTPIISVPLSFHDNVWLSMPPVQRLFLYPPSNTPFQTLISSLKSSLAYTLSSFYALAGKLTFDSSSRSVFIDCSDSAVNEGVTFSEAVCDDLDFDRLVREEVHDLDAFHRLVPDISITELPIPVFTVKVTKFWNGGVSLGIALHHAVMDGKGLWQFIHAWARNCKIGCAQVQFSMPVHDRSVITFEGDEEAAKELLEDAMPNLPKIMPDQPEEVFWHDNGDLSRRTFTIDKNSIETLKHIPLALDTTRVSPPSTFVSLVAHIWISLTQSRANIYGSKYPTSHLVLLIDVRAYLNPSVNQSYTGNCLSTGFVHMSCLDLLSPSGFAHACSNIERVIVACRQDPLSGCTEWHKEYMRISHVMTVSVAASPKFRAYDTDFGWGNPSRVELVSMHGDGEVAIVAGRGEGTVQISMSISSQFMDAFAKYFLKY